MKQPEIDVNLVTAGDIYVDTMNQNTANWFAATFIYQV